MEGNLLVSIAGVLLSLGFGYIPGLKEKFGALDGTRKALVMAGLLLAAAVGVFALSCWGPFDWATCDEAGAWTLVELFVAALVANQATYQIAVKPRQKS
jgi:hypothetical protein